MAIKITLAAHNEDGLIEEHEFIISEGSCEGLQQATRASRETSLDLLFEENDLTDSLKQSVLEYLADLN